MQSNWDILLGGNNSFFIFAIIIYLFFDGYLSFWYKKSLLRRVLTIFLELGLLAYITYRGSEQYPGLEEIFLLIFTYTSAAIILFPLFWIFLECFYLLSLYCLRSLWKVTRIDSIQILPGKDRPWSFRVLIITRI